MRNSRAAVYRFVLETLAAHTLLDAHALSHGPLFSSIDRLAFLRAVEKIEKRFGVKLNTDWMSVNPARGETSRRLAQLHVRAPVNGFDPTVPHAFREIIEAHLTVHGLVGQVLDAIHRPPLRITHL